jgi:hypothetical protein
MAKTGKITKFFGDKKIPADSASFWRRSASFIIDLLIINLIIFSQFSNNIVSYGSSMTFAESVSRQASLPTDAYLMIFVMFMLAWLYFVFFEYYLSQTPGQMILKLKVVNIEEKSSKTKAVYDSDITLWSAAVRNCFILTFTPFWFFWILDPIYLSMYGDRLLEKWTRTRTINMNAAMKQRNLEYELKKV